jgi:hypothetical protein
MAMQAKYYREEELNSIVALMQEEKTRTPERISYFVSPLSKQPGNFLMSYFTSKYATNPHPRPISFL